MATKVSIELGQKVRDKISGMEGIAVSRTEWMHGCVRVGVQPQELKDGVPLDIQVFDEPQLQVVKDTPAPKVKAKGGPRPHVGRAPDATRRD